MPKHTIYDIARLAGVSGKTVSRVLNDEPGVRPETRSRVESVIEQMGYQPHHGARSMRGQHRDCVGVVFSAPLQVVPISQQQVNWLFLELYRVFGARGKFICFDLNSSPNGTRGDDYARALWQRRCNGCIVHGALRLGDKTILRIHKSGSPYMALNRFDSIPDLCCATVDFEEAAYRSTKRLIDRGHTRIGMLQAFSKFQAGNERRNGYIRAYDESGIPVDDTLIRPVSFAGSEVTTATRELLVDQSATAIIDCSMLEDASWLLAGAAHAGRAPGSDFEIIDWTYGADSVVHSNACAHVRLPLREAGSEGIELLLQWFDRERDEPFQIIRRPELIEPDAIRDQQKATPVFDTLA
ncbi:MAG: LacI family DNA-binding transcriptional regulator [Candidatus Hydrogenedentes bacterium]|nr:LacI family DNA-binding transcriptional regulator [Candidatus Hydrogenedentota bacterium]